MFKRRNNLIVRQFFHNDHNPMRRKREGFSSSANRDDFLKGTFYRSDFPTRGMHQILFRTDIEAFLGVCVSRKMMSLAMSSRDYRGGVTMMSSKCSQETIRCDGWGVRSGVSGVTGAYNSNSTCKFHSVNGKSATLTTQLRYDIQRIVN